MIFETEPLTTSYITSICPSRDGHRLLVGSGDGTVRTWNMEDLAGNQSLKMIEMYKKSLHSRPPGR